MHRRIAPCRTPVAPRNLGVPIAGDAIRPRGAYYASTGHITREIPLFILIFNLLRLHEKFGWMSLTGLDVPGRVSRVGLAWIPQSRHPKSLVPLFVTWIPQSSHQFPLVLPRVVLLLVTRSLAQTSRVCTSSRQPHQLKSFTNPAAQLLGLPDASRKTWISGHL